MCTSIYQFIGSSWLQRESVVKHSCLTWIWFVPPILSLLLLLLLPKALRLLYGEHEFLLQLLIALVRREVQTIKA